MNNDECKDYNEENGIGYPLCNGAETQEQFEINDCSHCCIYKDMEKYFGYEEE